MRCIFPVSGAGREGQLKERLCEKARQPEGTSELRFRNAPPVPTNATCRGAAGWHSLRGPGTPAGASCVPRKGAHASAGVPQRQGVLPTRRAPDCVPHSQPRSSRLRASMVTRQTGEHQRVASTGAPPSGRAAAPLSRTAPSLPSPPRRARSSLRYAMPTQLEQGTCRGRRVSVFTFQLVRTKFERNAAAVLVPLSAVVLVSVSSCSVTHLSACARLRLCQRLGAARPSGALF